MTVSDFLFRGELAELDPDVAELIRHETARQARYLILVASESTVPQAVREALTSAFHNLYAEGYPNDDTRWMTQAEILDYHARLPEYRRFADKRYYKGTEYADIVEALARRRVAELFANERVNAGQLWVNVQPLSGAPANNAVYSALLEVGDTVMGMDLLHGGHLTHGSPVNRSGRNYNIVSYGVHPESELLDYDAIMELARAHRPKMIIAGYTSYPYAPDWGKFRAIADEVGAYLMADIAHVAGLVVAGAYPSPVGIADVVNFTTHKTFGGPRGAVILTHRKDIATKVDRAVFPGEQGGPHVNVFGALAVAARLAATEQFRELQHRTVANAVRFAQKLTEHGLRILHGGTDTHLLLIDCKTVGGADGTPLSGDMAARILDLAGIVVNRNTIPGDRSAFSASGLRLGTPWVTQRGFGGGEIDALAQIIADVLRACAPFSYSGRRRPQPRAKVAFDVLQTAKLAVRDLAARVGIDTDVRADGYPHFYYLDGAAHATGWQTLAIRGEAAAQLLNLALTSDVPALEPGGQGATWLLGKDGTPMTRAVLQANDADYHLHVESNLGRVAAWLRALSDGFVLFDDHDVYAKAPGPADVRALPGAADTGAFRVDIQGDWQQNHTGYAQAKAHFIGLTGANYAGPRAEALPEFMWEAPQRASLLTTPLHDLHGELGAKMVEFAGYDMPVWYTSVMDEHHAVRSSAGVFDVTHMGVFDVRGRGAAQFLDTVTTNDVHRLAPGDSHYTYLLDVHGNPLDDLMIYRIGDDHYLLVVNASNNDKNWAWLNAVINHEVAIDVAYPDRRVEGTDRFTLRDLRAPSSGADRRVDIALQGPESKNILLALVDRDEDRAKISKLSWAGITRVNLGSDDLVVSRTGYTGERVAYELFVHPERAAALFRELLKRGALPCGLAARDSLRIEAGLPLYGHELAGPLNLNPADAGFSNYVRLWKPFFVGKAAFVGHEQTRDAEVARFRLDSKGARPAHQGDPVVDGRGRVVGIVTSCSVDSDGYQTGQAYIKQDFMNAGAVVAVFAGSGRTPAGKSLNELTVGDRVSMPEAATILSRFPKRA